MEPFYIEYLTYLFYLLLAGGSVYGGYHGWKAFRGWWYRKRLRDQYSLPADLLFWKTGDHVIIHQYHYIDEKRGYWNVRVKGYVWDFVCDGQFVQALDNSRIIVYNISNSELEPDALKKEASKNPKYCVVIDLDDGGIYNIKNNTIAERAKVAEMKNNKFQDSLDEARESLFGTDTDDQSLTPQ